MCAADKCRSYGRNWCCPPHCGSLEEMAALGAEQAIVSLGGNVQTLGDVKPDGSQWQVAITDPKDTGDYLALLHVGQKAIVTSGGYQRFFEQDGRTYIHILDPATGCPVDNGLTSITVGTHEANPTEIKCTDCESFKLK